MDLFGEVRRYSRMALGVFELARTPAIADPRANLRQNLENRATNFLNLAAQAIYANPRNPYHKMLHLAQCEYPDLERAVTRDGLEPALEGLLRAGVYLTNDELKGKTPIIRCGQQIPSEDSSYENPLVRTRIEARSGGSRSAGSRTGHSPPSQVHWEHYWSLTARNLGIERDAYIALLPILPSITGLMVSLRGPLIGWNVKKWYALGGNLWDSWHCRAATRAMVATAKMAGASCSFPTYLPNNDFTPVAQYIAQKKATGLRCCVGGFVSPAVRVAAAAMEQGLDISGTIFWLGGEALTPAKRKTIEAAGGEVYPFYAIAELGPVGHSCPRIKTGNCVHLFDDLVGVITRTRLAPLSEVEVNSLLFTTLTPFASRALINAEMDDSGIIEKVSCDCEFGRLGYQRQIRNISSYGKLTGQGMTLAGTDVLQVLEDALPRRFGGSAGDYQLVENEGIAQTVMILRISPRVGPVNPDQVREYFLNELKRCYGGTLTARTWKHAEAVTITIAEPLATPAGKVLPLHLIGTGDTESHTT